MILNICPRDAEFEDESRSLVGFTHEQDFARQRGHAFLTFNRVSDSEYFEDFGSNLAVSSTRYLPRRADISYRGDYFNLRGRLHGFQTIDPTIEVEDRPYDRAGQPRDPSPGQFLSQPAQDVGGGISANSAPVGRR